MNYEGMTVKQLKQEVVNRELGLMYLSQLKKDELIEALRRDDKGMTPTKPLAGWDDYGKCIANK